jgi:DNA-binding transcriptional MocR family regulator
MAGPSPAEKVIGALREAITGGAVPPGTYLDPRAIGREHGITTPEATSALAALRGEGIIHGRDHRRYAAPAGPPGPGAGARVGEALARMREEAALSPEDLDERARAHGGWWWSARAVREAEGGEWQPREFWAAADAALGAGGALLEAHDRAYAAPEGRLRPGPEPVARGPALHHVTAGIRSRVLAGEWPPGTPLPDKTALAAEHATTATYIGLALSALGAEGLLDPPRAGYHIPAAGSPPGGLPLGGGRALAGVVLHWDDGTATPIPVTAAPAVPTGPAEPGHGSGREEPQPDPQDPRTAGRPSAPPGWSAVRDHGAPRPGAPHPR